MVHACCLKYSLLKKFYCYNFYFYKINTKYQSKIGLVMKQMPKIIK